jgi:hypothetical protein
LDRLDKRAAHAKNGREDGSEVEIHPSAQDRSTPRSWSVMLSTTMMASSLPGTE